MSNEMSGGTESWHTGKSQQNRDSTYKYPDSTYKHPWWKSWLRKDGKIPKGSNKPSLPRPVPLRNVADLIYRNKLKQNHKNIYGNLTFTLATDEKSSRKIVNPKYDPMDIEMN